MAGKHVPFVFSGQPSGWSYRTFRIGDLGEAVLAVDVSCYSKWMDFRFHPQMCSMYKRMMSYSVVSSLVIILVKASMASLLPLYVHIFTLLPLHMPNISPGYSSDDQRFVHGSGYRWSVAAGSGAGGVGGWRVVAWDWWDLLSGRRFSLGGDRRRIISISKGVRFDFFLSRRLHCVTVLWCVWE